jgi:hypothetical protein
MKKLSYNFNAIYLSLYSKIFYWNLLKNLKHTGFSYILILAIISSSISSLVVSKTIINTKNNVIEKFTITNESDEIIGLTDFFTQKLSDIPKFKVKESSIEFEITEPRIISDETPDGLVLVFDPTDKFNPDHYNSAFVINTQKIIAKSSNREDVFYLKKLQPNITLAKFVAEDGFVDNKKLIISALNVLNKYVWVLAFGLFVIGFIGAFLGLAISAIFYAFVAQTMFLLFKLKSADFRNCLRLAAYTTTPIFILDVFQMIILRQIFGMQILVYFVIHLVYIFYAIDAFKDIETNKKKL